VIVPLKGPLIAFVRGVWGLKSPRLVVVFATTVIHFPSKSSEPVIVGIVVLALLLFALIKMLPDLVRYMKIRSM
jgi:hypothetical protein